jgi:glycosyltransferase involved in cell wall biosynthesis
MRVGLVVSNDLDYGLDVANALDRAGVSVNMYLSYARVALYLPGITNCDGLPHPDRLVERLHAMELVPSACRVRLFRFPRIRDPRSLAVILKISQTLRSDGVDVAHILMGPGELWIAVLASFLRYIMPVVSTMIIPRPNVGENLPTTLLLATNKLLAFGSHMIIVNGSSQVKLVHKLYGISTHKIVYVPLGPRTSAVKWSAERLTEEPGTVLFCGRADPHKGLEYLVKAQPIITQQVPHARIVIAAHGKELERWRQMAKDNPGFEIHEGFLTSDVLAAFFQRSSLVALPYVSASTSGLMMTAYVFGKPVVATSVGSLPEYVKDGVTGFLVPPADVEQLAGAIVHLLTDNTLRHRMGEQATHWVNEIQKDIAMQTLGVYERAISIRKNGKG